MKRFLSLVILCVFICFCILPVNVNAALPVTVKGRNEADLVKTMPGFSYTLESVHEVDGRQGIAWYDGKYYVSGSTTLSCYDKDWNLINENNKPFEGFDAEVKVNHLGDIDVYNGEIYACVEYFMDGAAKDIQIAIYDAETLKLKRTYPVEPASGQTECSGITVDTDYKSVWMCAWNDGESGRYLYRYDLNTGEYLGKYHLQCPPQWIQGIVYYDGWIYITADDGTADDGEPDHIYRCRVDLSKTSFETVLERTLDDVKLQGEIEGISIDKTNRQMLISYNRGSQIVLGMIKGFYDGYTKEIHEVYAYDMERYFRPIDYSIDDYWVSKPTKIKKSADVFFVLPTVDLKKTYPDNEDILSIKNSDRFFKTYNLEKGIVEYAANVFAPLYRQMTMGSYMEEGNQRIVQNSAFLDSIDDDDIAYADVRNAFEYYLKNLNGGRGIVLFGYSQGGDMLLKLLAEFGEDERFKDKYIAAYIIGTSLTEEYLAEHPYLKAAKGKKDTGVIISFNAVDERMEYNGEKEVSINPLNWKTSGKKADKSLNKGYATFDVNGKMTEKILNYCGAYINKKTGKLIVTDIEGQDSLYETETGFFAKGDYHLYELNFFYQNLRKNIAARIKVYKQKSINNVSVDISVDKETLFQVSLLQGLTFGDYNGSITVAQLKKKGDIGLGTFDGLDGEMIVLDGIVYKAKSDGAVEVVADDETIPFSNVTFFDADDNYKIKNISDIDRLKNILNKKIADKVGNGFCVIRIDGKFKEINVRSECEQEKPYKPLATVLETDQSFFDYSDIEGTVVGLYCPQYMDRLNAAGWHLHFISNDKEKGGHVLGLSVDFAELNIDYTQGFEMQLPDNEMFNSFDLTIDQSDDIKKVETGDGK